MATEVFQTFDNGYRILMDSSGWNDMFILEAPDGRRTYRSAYESAMTLDGLVAISPYYTAEEVYILVSPEEAIEYIAFGEEKIAVAEVSEYDNVCDEEDMI